MSLRYFGNELYNHARPKYSYWILLKGLCWVSICWILYNGTVFHDLDVFWFLLCAPLSHQYLAPYAVFVEILKNLNRWFVFTLNPKYFFIKWIPIYRKCTAESIRIIRLTGIALLISGNWMHHNKTTALHFWVHSIRCPSLINGWIAKGALHLKDSSPMSEMQATYTRGCTANAWGQCSGVCDCWGVLWYFKRFISIVVIFSPKFIRRLLFGKLINQSRYIILV